MQARGAEILSGLKVMEVGDESEGVKFRVETPYADDVLDLFMRPVEMQ